MGMDFRHLSHERRIHFFKVEFTIAARGKFFPTRRDVRDSAVYKGPLIDDCRHMILRLVPHPTQPLTFL